MRVSLPLRLASGHHQGLETLTIFVSRAKLDVAGVTTCGRCGRRYPTALELASGRAGTEQPA